MTGEENANALLPVHVAQKGPDRVLHVDVQPYCGLVQIQKLRPVQKDHADICLHALPQRKFPWRRIEHGAEIKKIRNPLEIPVKFLPVNLI